MSDSNNLNNLVDLTGPDEPAKKLRKLLTGFFPKYDPRDPAHVAAKVDRERKESESVRIRREKAEAKQLAADDERKRAEAERKRNERAAKKAQIDAAKAAAAEQDATLQLQAGEFQQQASELLLSCVILRV